jgi:hypothetical protein
MSVGPHDLLDNLVHTDSAAGDPTKGDLIVGSGSEWDDLAVGTDGHVLTADSGETLGVKWAAAAGGGLDFTSVLTPTGLSGNVDNYAPTGWGPDIQLLRVGNGSGSVSRTITGLDGTDGGTAPADGQWVYIENIGDAVGETLILADESGSSAAENRFQCPNGDDVTIAINEVVLLVYDTSAAAGVGRWVVHKARTPTATTSVSGGWPQRCYTWYIDSADSSTYLVTGNALGPIHDTNTDYAEVVVRIVHAVKVAGTGGSDNLTVQLQFNSGEDLDTESWTEIDSNSLGQNVNGSVVTSSFTNGSGEGGGTANIPVSRLLRLNITSITGNWQGLTVHLVTRMSPTITTSVTA